MALLTHQVVTDAGLSLTMAAAAAGGDTYAINDDDAWLVVHNDSVSSINVTLVTPATYRGLAVADLVKAVAAGAIAVIPLNRALYRDPADGLLDITYSAVTTVTVAIARF